MEEVQEFYTFFRVTPYHGKMGWINTSRNSTQSDIDSVPLEIPFRSFIAASYLTAHQTYNFPPINSMSELAQHAVLGEAHTSQPPETLMPLRRSPKIEFSVIRLLPYRYVFHCSDIISISNSQSKNDFITLNLGENWNFQRSIWF